ncbi:Nif11-like leader peptide family natural product precursor [Nostoc sp. ChiQUE01b]|uniref:Nif11-like leader peptide family natural product precursor n=1 Tax=Nostoc sp. ChiQUE01b TaxID=3075376 RepID=UPI002AD39BA0|nr:Nif11-like leader peptide family natural product precursor [Nostoc sp. ChiQUE01b]MDZ8262446.1 Nif11-like leader peptide family natural product precursor [Nostoc sp. ChiQUE01b]
MSVENVQAFYARLASDEAFRNQMQGVTSKDECSQLVKGAGYDFTQEEFEEYTAQLLESEAAEGELQDLGEKELEAVVGGLIQSYNLLIYGAPSGLWNNIDCPHKPPGSQLAYGVIQSDISQIA